MTNKKLSLVERLYDDESTREKYTVMTKMEVMFDDARNNGDDFWEQIETFLQWGKAYRITVEELDEDQDESLSCSRKE